MMSFSSRIARPAASSLARRAFASGPASGGEISDELLSRLGSLSTQALVDGLWVMGWPSAQIDAARALAPGMKCCGRAVTLKFVPARPDIAADKPPGGESPEYEAFEKCGPNEVSQSSLSLASLPRLTSFFYIKIFLYKKADSFRSSCHANILIILFILCICRFLSWKVLDQPKVLAEILNFCV